MKKYILVASLLLLSIGGAKAQTLYDGVLFSQKDLSGTARFVGMGGALGALGADISTMGVNPAGIGLYRSNDANFTVGYTNTQVKSNYLGNKYDNDKGKFNIPSAGFVLSIDMGYSPLKYLNFGFNYTRSKNFYSNMAMGGRLNRTNNGEIVSITHVMDQQANGMYDGGNGPDVADLIDNKKPVYRYSDVGWMGALGYDGRFIRVDNEGYHSYLPDPDAYFTSRSRGGIDQYDFNISGNVNDRFFWGLTIGAYDVNYSRDTYYREEYGMSQYGFLDTQKDIEGSGFDFKFGAILRPIESSPFRIGLAVHTPIFYRLKHYTNTLMESDISATGIDKPVEGDFTSKFANEDMDNQDYLMEYRLRTPWKTNISLGHNVGNFLAIGAEYEYEDYSTMNFKYEDGYNMDFYNNQTSMLKGVHTLRLGLEYRIVPEFAIRTGYNYQSAIFKNNAFNDVPLNSKQTDIQYTNDNKSRNTFTFGLGYSGKVFYGDLGFQFNSYKSKFRPFDDTELKFTNLTTNQSQILFTLGMRL